MFERLPAPRQMSSVLCNSLAQHSMSLHMPAAEGRRLEDWIIFQLTQAVQYSDMPVGLEQLLQARARKFTSDRSSPPSPSVLWTGSLLDHQDPSQFQDLLVDPTVRFTRFIQEFSPRLQSLLLDFVQGRLFVVSSSMSSFQKLLVNFFLSIVPFFPLDDFSSLQSELLRPLRSIISSTDAVTAARAVFSLTSLFRRLLHARLVDARVQSATSSANGRDSTKSRQARRSVFSKSDSQPKPADGDPLLTIRNFIIFMDSVAVSSLESHQDHAAVQHSVLSFYELVSTLNMTHSTRFVVTPSPPVVYRSLQSSSAMAVSRICGIIASYKSELDLLKHRGTEGSYQGPPLSFPNGIGRISEFNSYILDICNALWRDRLDEVRPSSTSLISWPLPLHPNALGLLQQVDVKRSLSIAQSSAFATFALEYLSQQRRQSDGPLQPSDLKDHRVNYLTTLRDHHMGGLYRFLHTFISTLADKAKQTRTPSSARSSSSSRVV
mmetsp:Transcript_16523/g.27097  ORF Transcript_16523/g.27097 Transcript_16523/m.27097 type:complete len:492 (+) Transcript_16523:1099-2574(+)